MPHTHVACLRKNCKHVNTEMALKGFVPRAGVPHAYAPREHVPPTCPSNHN